MCVPPPPPPPQIKTVLTRRRSFLLTLTVVVYHVTICSFLYIDVLDYNFGGYNARLAVYTLYMYVIPSTTGFFIILIATLLLVVTLRRKQRWRQETSSRKDDKGNKENKQVRTVIAINTLFIACSVLSVGMYAGQLINLSFRYSDHYLGTIVIILFDISWISQSTSSAVNIFFYYSLSSKYKQEFSKLFMCKD